MADVLFDFKTSGLGETIKQVNELAAAERQLQRFTTDLTKAYQALGMSQSDAEAKAKGLVQASNLTAKSFIDASKSSKDFRDGLNAIGVAAGLTSAALAKIGADGIKAFADFDRAIRTFGVVTDSSGTPQLAALRQEVERLGSATTKTPQEIANVAVELGKAGFSAERTKEALAGVVQSSEATGEGLARTGEVIGATLNQFGLAATDSLKIADLLTTASNASAAGTNDLGEALSYVGAQAKASNQTVEDTVTTLALLANAGIKGSSAGTGLAEALRRVKLASANATTEFSDLKSRGSKAAVAAFNQIDASVRDANGQLLPFPQILKNLKTELAGVAKESDKELILNALFGVQGGRVIQSLLNQTSEQIGQVTDKMEFFAGSSKKASEELTGGASGGLALFNSSLQLFNQKVGETLTTAVLPLIQGATALLNGFLALPAPVQNALVAIGGFVAVLTAAGAAIIAFNALNLGAGLTAVANAALAATGSMGAFAGSTATAGGAVTALGVALRAALPPLIAISAGIAAISFIRYTKDLEGFNQALDDLSNGAQVSGDAAISLANKIKNINDARKAGKQFTDEDLKKQKQLVEISKQQVAALEDQLKQVKAATPVNEEQKNAQAALVANLEASIRALKGQTTALKNNVDESISQAGAKAAAADATDRQSKSAKDNKEAIAAETDQIKAQTEALKEQRQQQFQDTEKKISRAGDDSKLARQKADQEQISQLQEDTEARISAAKKQDEEEIAKLQEANQKRLQNAQKDFEQNTLEPLKQAGERRIQDTQKNFERNELEPLKIQQEQQVQKAQADFESNVLAPLKLENERQIQSEESAFNQEQAAFKAEAEAQIRAEEKSFNQQQNAEERAFKRQLQAEEKAFKKSLDAEQKGIDRQLQLEFAESPEEKKRLEEQFKKDDALAKRRAELEAPLQAKREAFELQQQAKEEAFRQQQDQKKLDFEANVLNPLKAQLDDALNQRKLEFETNVLNPLKAQLDQQLEQRKLEFEQTVLAPLRQQLEDQLNAKREAFEQNTLLPLRKQLEAEIEARREQFETNTLTPLRKRLEGEIEARRAQSEENIKELRKQSEAEIDRLRESAQKRERDLDRQAEDARTARERAFRAEQRKLDEESAKRIEQIKKQSTPTTATQPKPGQQPKPKARKMGGSVEAGESYVVGEKEPELFVPNANGVILNKSQARKNIDLLEKVGEIRFNPKLASPTVAANIAASMPGRQTQQLIAEIRELKGIIRQMEPKIEIPTTFTDDGAGHRTYEKMVRLQRTLIRARLN